MKTGSAYRTRLPVLICGIGMLIGILFTLSACGAVKDAAKKILRGRPNPAKLDTGLPVIHINTSGGRPVVSKDLYLAADIEIKDPDDSRNNLSGKVEIRGRGNSTWGNPKKPYRIRFPKKTALFAYEKARSWVLLANFQDKTLLMNSIGFELGRRFGLPFTPHFTHVELVLNGRYEGSYLLTEQIQVGPGRVDIDKDGGFLVELDEYYDEEPKFRTSILGLPVMIKHPENVEDSGYDFVKSAINDLEASMFSSDFPNTNYLDLIDINTFIDYIMINEITRNWDIQLPHSVFLYRDKGSRICLGPLWDFDRGFDYDGRKYYFANTGGTFYNTVFHDGPGQIFFNRFFEDPVFRAAYRERWNAIYSELADMDLFIDQMAARLERSHRANDLVWWWRAVDYQKEISRLKEWWKTRRQVLMRPPAICHGGTYAPR
jgi:spore coat protein CotH